jgi:hypothetical protein
MPRQRALMILGMAAVIGFIIGMMMTFAIVGVVRA